MEEPLEDPVILSNSASEVRCLAFSPDGKTLAARHRTDEVYLWNVATWREMIQLQSNWLVAFSADGRCLLTDGKHTPETTEGRITIREAALLTELAQQNP